MFIVDNCVAAATLANVRSTHQFQLVVAAQLTDCAYTMKQCPQVGLVRGAIDSWHMSNAESLTQAVTAA